MTDLVDSRSSTGVGDESNSTSEDEENDGRDKDKNQGNEVNFFETESKRVALVPPSKTEVTELREHDETLSQRTIRGIKTPSGENSVVSETMQAEPRASSVKPEKLAQYNEMVDFQQAWKSERASFETDLSAADESPRLSIDIDMPTDSIEAGESLLRYSSEATAPPHSDSNTTASREGFPQQDSHSRQVLLDDDIPADCATGGESFPCRSSKKKITVQFEEDTKSRKIPFDLEDFETQSESGSELDKVEPEDTELTPIPEHNHLIRSQSNIISRRRHAGESSASTDLLLETDSDSGSNAPSDSDDSKTLDKSNRKVATDAVEWQQSTEGIVRMAEVAAATISTTPTQSKRTSKYLKLFAPDESVSFSLSNGCLDGQIVPRG